MDLVQDMLVGLEFCDRDAHRSARYVDADDVDVVGQKIFVAYPVVPGSSICRSCTGLTG